MDAIIGNVTPIKDHVIVHNMDFEDQRTKSGIIVRSDNGKVEGIKPRWAQVWAIGPDQQDVKVGDWILIEHGRWTRGFKIKNENNEQEVVIHRVDVEAILMIHDHKPEDITFGN